MAGADSLILGARPTRYTAWLAAIVPFGPPWHPPSHDDLHALRLADLGHDASPVERAALEVAGETHEGVATRFESAHWLLGFPSECLKMTEGLPKLVLHVLEVVDERSADALVGLEDPDLEARGVHRITHVVRATVVSDELERDIALEDTRRTEKGEEPYRMTPP
jgi:hypothetical protein